MVVLILQGQFRVLDQNSLVFEWRPSELDNPSLKSDFSRLGGEVRIDDSNG